MCELNKKGAMGLIINKLFKDPTLKKIFDNFYDKKNKILNAVDQIYFGGPVMVERGIVLHSGNYNSNDSIKISNDFFISRHKKTLEDISAKRGPELNRLLLGHAGWNAGQLEREIEMICDAMPALEKLDQLLLQGAKTEKTTHSPNEFKSLVADFERELGRFLTS